MSFQYPISSAQLLDQAESEQLYHNLIVQLNKDFTLANEPVDFELDIAPQQLKAQLHDKIYRLIQYKFAEYLNLLYIVDVPEEQIKQLDGTDLVVLAEEVSFILLKREWQKVWYRAKYSGWLDCLK